MAIVGDNPIRRAEDDALGRAGVAHAFARQVLSLDASEGVVVGVLGAWGCGKTSFINLARPEFDSGDIPVLDFNPWMFSGAEQLVESFFIEVAAQLRLRRDLAELGRDFEDYGELFSGMGWLPFVGPWIERGRGASKILGRILQRRREGVGGRRAKLEKALIDYAKPLVVVLDDIDRLSSSEIRDVFKLVRLTASFPHVIYIVAFDRVRVEEALAEQGVPGRDYLEKILQVAVDLPAVPAHVLSNQLLAAINDALEGVDLGPFDEQLWPDVFMEVIRPLVRNMRDVRRYAAAIRGTVPALGGQVTLADVLALEAVRVFLPDVFVHVQDSANALTTTAGFYPGAGGERPQLKVQVESLLETAGAHADVVRAMIGRLFPAADRHIGGTQYGADWKARWLRERRVAHEDVLRFYLERVAGEGMRAFMDAERAWSHMTDRDALDGFLRSLEATRQQDVIAALEIFEDEYSPEQVVPATVVLLNLLPDLPERQGGMFDFGTSLVVTRVTLRLLRSLKDPGLVEDAVRQILPELRSLTSKLELITVVGYREGAGHKLVSESAARSYERAWRDEVHSASTDELVNEKYLLRILLATKREGDLSEGALVVEDSPALTQAVIRAARSDVRSQTMGSRAVRRLPRLAWDALVEIYGAEVTLKERIENLKATQPEDSDQLLELAEKYLDGWRPTEFGDD